MRIPTLLLLAAPLAASACVGTPRSTCPPVERCRVVNRPAPSVEPARTDLPHRLYDGTTGRETTLAAFVAEARRADVVAFGELHGDPVGAAYELALLQALGTSGRPLALAMEFFERDHQDALKAYLAGKMDEGTFREETGKQGDAYARTHGPLITWARDHGVYVVAANAPRRHVKGFRESGLDYPAWRAALPPEERRYTPRAFSVIDDAYRERFLQVMGGMPDAMAASFFKSQSLWDDAMAEAIADFRAVNPRHRVMLVVGGFHVEDGLGTITKLKQRRPGDRVAILLMEAVGADDEIAFDDSYRGGGDAVLVVKMPKREGPSGANPHAAPKKEGAEDESEAPDEGEPDESEPDESEPDESEEVAEGAGPAS